ncbi:clathrin light chain 2 [Lactuca sativa]|uniref:clathrin light chain 2 n=1 Tax=Lactuca sativa TaxID=4236 RepID=UPI000CC1288C|nr:clathrin light chain 2 [Lactuca sativa]
MSSSFDDSVADPVHLSDYGFVVEDSPVLVTEEEQVFNYPSPTPILVYGGGLSPDQPEISSFNENGTPFEGEYMALDGSILPPLSEMQPEEGFALKEWRRENALRLEEKEKIEKELLNQIIDEADD